MFILYYIVKLKSYNSKINKPRHFKGVLNLL